MMVKLAVHPFARRQVADSAHSHFEGSWDELVVLVQQAWRTGVTSPHNPGVQLVPMPTAMASRFFCSVVPVTSKLPLQVTWQPRVPGEAPFFQVSSPVSNVRTAKAPAHRVEIVCYRHDILAADNDIPDDVPLADYYLININAYATEAPEPMHPMTMARNLLGLPGGTVPPVPYTAQEFAQAVVYWNQHVRLGPQG
jgi:hypothetical protein